MKNFDSIRATLCSGYRLNFQGHTLPLKTHDVTIQTINGEVVSITLHSPMPNKSRVVPVQNLNINYERQAVDIADTFITNYYEAK